MTEKRLLILYCAVFLFAFVVELKMVSLITSDYASLAEKQTVRTIDISTGRADIVDCNKNKITGIENTVKAFITSETQLQNIYENIRPQDREKFYQRIQQEKQLVVDVTSTISSDEIYTVSKRYTSTNYAQHLIGYTDLEGNGLAGIERAYNELLKDNGEKISVHFNVNGNGDIYGDAYSTVSRTNNALCLTIDNSLQRMRESVAAEYIPNGSIIIMESATGKIKAMASTPTYNANNIADYLDAENSPLVNKSLQSYEPGSVIKPLWAAALLENGLDKDKIYYCNGYTTINNHTYHCANNRAHGPITLQDALVYSCNCYFIDSVVENKGFVMRQLANQLEFGKAIKLCENLYTTSGNFPSVTQIDNMGVQSSACFGQGDFRLSPVHVTAFMNIFANNGVYVYPQVVESVYELNSNKTVQQLYSLNAKRVFAKETADTVKEMLERTVQDGPSDRRQPLFLTAGGKTGTAQTGKVKETGEEIFTAWFCGFYPAENPEYTICITMYDGGESTYSAAPVFKKICDNIFFMKYA